MKRLDEIKLRNQCKKEGRLKEYEDYKKHLKLVQTDIERFSRYLEEEQSRYEKELGKNPQDPKMISYYRNQIDRWRYKLDRSKLEINFVRPNSRQDIEYRERQSDEFVPKLQSVISPNLDLRFHGTPIYLAEQIIKSGEISSTADRYLHLQKI